MTPERVAELRRLAMSAQKHDNPNVLAEAIQELLDELEALTSQLVDNSKRHATEIDSLAAQVARLREALQAFSRRDAWVRLPREDFNHSIAAPQIYGWNDFQEPWRINDKLLADTEAAATAWLKAHDREQRLAGAKEGIAEMRKLMVQRFGSDGAPRSTDG